MKSNSKIDRRRFIKQTSIGLGGMGNTHIRWFSGFPDVDIVALCDVDQLRLDKTRKNISDLSSNF